MACKGDALLGVAAATLLTVGVGCSGSQAQTAGQYRVVASVDEVMEGITIPAAQRIFDAVVYSNGELVQAPRTDDDWFALRISAMAVAESGNLLMMPSRAKDDDAWMERSRALVDAAVKVAEAAEAKDIERILETGSAMYLTCTACHEIYIPDEEP